jgi:putative peptidoglycan lipid II flippase
LVSGRDWNGLRQVLRLYGIAILVLSCAVTTALYWMSPYIVALLFERKQFSHNDTILVSAIQRSYCLQIPFYLLSILLVRLISALQANRLLLYSASISLVLDIILNWIFMGWWGAPGIGLSTTVVYFTSCTFLALQARKLIRARSSRNLSKFSDLRAVT